MLQSERSQRLGEDANGRIDLPARTARLKIELLRNRAKSAVVFHKLDEIIPSYLLELSMASKVTRRSSTSPVRLRRSVIPTKAAVTSML